MREFVVSEVGGQRSYELLDVLSLTIPYRETVDGKYHCATKLLPLTAVANFEKKVPIEWITPEGNQVTDDFIDYVLPLIQGEAQVVKEQSMPRYARLKKILAK